MKVLAGQKSISQETAKIRGFYISYSKVIVPYVAKFTLKFV